MNTKAGPGMAASEPILKEEKGKSLHRAQSWGRCGAVREARSLVWLGCRVRDGRMAGW